MGVNHPLFGGMFHYKPTSHWGSLLMETRRIAATQVCVPIEEEMWCDRCSKVHIFSRRTAKYIREIMG